MIKIGFTAETRQELEAQMHEYLGYAPNVVSIEEPPREEAPVEEPAQVEELPPISAAELTSNLAKIRDAMGPEAYKAKLKSLGYERGRDIPEEKRREVLEAMYATE